MLVRALYPCTICAGNSGICRNNLHWNSNQNTIIHNYSRKRVSDMAIYITLLIVQIQRCWMWIHCAKTYSLMFHLIRGSNISNNSIRLWYYPAIYCIPHDISIAQSAKLFGSRSEGVRCTADMRYGNEYSRTVAYNGMISLLVDDLNVQKHFTLSVAPTRFFKKR